MEAETAEEKKEDNGPTTDVSTIAVNKPKLKEQGSVSSTGKKIKSSKTKPLYFWTSADVNKWLKKHGGHCHDLYGELFLQQDITGRTLIRLNEIRLEQIGITNPQHSVQMAMLGSQLLPSWKELGTKHGYLNARGLKVDFKESYDNKELHSTMNRQELLHFILKLRLRHEATDLKNLDQKGSGFELPVPDTKKQSVKEKKDKR